MSLSPDARSALHESMHQMDQSAFEQLLIRLVIEGEREADLTEEIVTYLKTAPHSVQEFWLGECNCNGHLN